MPTLRTVLGIAGIGHVVALDDARQALTLLSRERFDAVFCGAGVAVDGRPFPAAARASRTAANRMIPLFLVHERACRGDVERARDDGVTDVLTSPISAQTVIDKLGTALARPKAFISTPNFFGPDRRTPRAAFEGLERRVRQPRKVTLAVKSDPAQR